MERRIKVGLILLETLVLLGVFLVAEPSLNPLVYQYAGLARQGYDIVYLYDSENFIDNSYYDVGDVLTYKKQNKLKAEILMQKPVGYSDYTCFSLTRKLASNEVLISGNLMGKLKLTVGDQLELHNPLYDQYCLYRVSGVLPVAFGLFEDVVDPDCGVVIVGYDEKIPKMTHLKSVLFEKNAYKASGAGFSLNKSMVKNEGMRKVGEAIIINMTGLIVASLVVMGLFGVALYMLGSPRLTHLLKYGANVRIQKRYVFSNYTLINLAAILLSGGLFVFCCVLKSILFPYWLIALIAILVGVAFIGARLYRLFAKKEK